MGVSAEPCQNQAYRDSIFNRIIHTADVSERTREILTRSRVLKVLVEAKKRIWEVYLENPELIEAEEIEKLARHIKDHVPGLDRVEVRVRFNPPNDITKINKEGWSNLLENLFAKEKLVQEWIRQSKVEIEDDILTIRLKNEIGLQFLMSKGYHRIIAEHLMETFNKSFKVNLEVSKVTEPWIGEEVDKEYLGALTPSLPATTNTSINTKKNEDGVIWGKTFSGASISLREVVDEEKSVIVQGIIYNLEIKSLKSGRNIITFAITDYTDSIIVKIFDDDNKSLSLGGKLENGKTVKVRGAVQLDRFSQELTLMARDIMTGVLPIRLDEASQKRVELHAHTKMSSMDGVVDVKALVKRAAFWGHPAIAITDHGVVQAFPEAYEAGKKHQVKIIYGVEGYLVEQDCFHPGEKIKSFHCIILVKNAVGLRNLYKLISLSHLDYFLRRPRIPRRILQEYREGLIIGSACEAGELFQALLAKASDDELLAIAEFYDYLEIQPLGNNQFMVRKGIVKSEEELKFLNLKILDLGKQLNKPVVATGDVHFLEPGDEIYRRILMAGKGFEDAEDQAPLYYRTTQEMLEEFAYLGEAAWPVVVENPRRIAEEVEEIKPIPDELYAPKIPGAEEQVREMAINRAKELYGEVLPDIVQKRLDKELNSIINNGFAVLYLIAHKLVKKSNDDGYLVGSRGSVGSSLVATMTGITEVNPLPSHYLCPQCRYSEFITDGSVGSGADLPDKLCPECGTPLKKDGHDIPFETFLGFHGDKVPDIDLNFSGEYQPRAHKYVEELFGKDFVFRAGTIATLADKTAFGFVKNYLDERKIPARSAEVARLVEGCSGVKRTTGQHPGGLMVVPKGKDIHEFTPVQRPADDQKSEVVTTHFDYHSISSRLVKLDILGHDDPTVIKMLEDLTGVNARFIPLDDAKTMSLFSGVEALGVTPEEINSQLGTFGIPEFGTRFVRQMLEDTKPTTFSELVRISGFSHGTDVWLNNAQDLIKSGQAKLSEAISTRDDIMVYLIYKGMEPGLAFKIMEGVRKGKGVKAEDEAKMREHGVPEWYIQSCQKIKYMFPKAHAVAYVTMAFRIAYFKVYYPEAFYASFFTVRADEFDADLICQGPERVRLVMEELERKGADATQKEKNLLTILEMANEMYIRGKKANSPTLKFCKVDLYRSDAKRFLITPEGLMPPLASLQGVGATAAQNIVQAREAGPFTSVEDLRTNARISKSVIDALESHGCLKGMAETNQLALFK